MRMEAESQNAKLQQFAMEQEAQRLAADRLEQYRQAEIENRKGELGIQEKRLGSMDIAQQRADEAARHNMAMEEARLNQDKMRPEAGIVELPELPGFKLIKNPSGALTIAERPPHAQSPLERARLQMTGINAMAPRGAEDPSSLDYQTRTNAIGGILRSLSPTNLQPPSPYKEGTILKNKKDGKTYRVVGGVPVQEDQTDEEDAD